jgi:trimethylamine-N-oxide reductase (cytochrome c)
MGALTSCVDVKDGKIVRTRPMQIDEQYTAEELRPWSIKARGGSFDSTFKTDIPPFAYVYKKRAYSKNRVPFPMKRADWDPNGPRHTHNRGKSKFERISWDEATDIIAAEIKRIQGKYGPYAILCQGDGHGEDKVVHAAHGCQIRLLNLMGGCTMQARNPDSWEGWYWGAKHVWGGDPTGQADLGNVLTDFAENTDLFIHWGCDVETNTWGWEGMISSKYTFFMTEIGIKQVFISPDLNYSGAVHADRWIPVFPNTDAALQLAVAYTWITNDWFDREYVNTHAVGFDWIEYYVLGKEDGIPKTPEWAEPICGVPARIIKALAKQWHELRTSIGHCNGGSYIRSIHSMEPGRLEPVLMGMQGLGKPGRNVIKFIEWGLFALPNQCPNPLSTLYPDAFGAYQGYSWRGQHAPDAAIHKFHIPKTMVPEAILGGYTKDHPLRWHGTGHFSYPREDQFVEYQYPNAETGEQIHMIWTDTPCWTTCWNEGNRFIAAIRHPTIEFVVAQHPWLENDCLYADIILPVSTKFEQRDVAVDCNNGYFNLFYIEPQCIEPIGEAKSDWECVCAVADKLGLLGEYTSGNGVDDWIRNGFENSGVEQFISWDEFVRKGYYAAPTKEGWEDNPRGFAPFCEDPEAHPLHTPTGKLEFYSATLEENFPGDKERPPYPKWIKTSDSHPAERFDTERAGMFPFLLVSNHPRWRVHANMDDISWLREIETCKVVGSDGYKYEPIWVNPTDAVRLGLANGDVAKLFNERGGVLGGVYVTERIMPGVLYQDHGARLDPIVTGELDRGGANNLIAPHKCAAKHTSAEVTSGFLVGISKVDVFELARQYPEAFNRDYDPAVGVEISSWLVEG